MTITTTTENENENRAETLDIRANVQIEDVFRCNYSSWLAFFFDRNILKLKKKHGEKERIKKKIIFFPFFYECVYSIFKVTLWPLLTLGYR